MIMSMTGFGKAIGQFKTKKVTLELKSLNSKQTDIAVRIPSLYKEKEMDMRSMIFKALQRGKIELSIYVENSGADSNQIFNKDLAVSYFKDLKSLAAEIGQESPDYIGTIIRMPDVLKPIREELSEEEKAFISDILSQAMENLVEFRAQEGAKLKTEFEGRIRNILEKLLVVEKFDPIRIEGIKQRIQKSLSEIKGEDGVDMNRQEQELIYYLEKLDLTEEKVRLRAHCDYFIETLNSTKSEGKKLGFIAQEIGREINTIGSKANNADIQKAVVQMKDELEKIKEQVLNVL